MEKQSGVLLFSLNSFLKSPNWICPVSNGLHISCIDVDLGSLLIGDTKVATSLL